MLYVTVLEHGNMQYAVAGVEELVSMHVASYDDIKSAVPTSVKMTAM